MNTKDIVPADKFDIEDTLLLTLPFGMFGALVALPTQLEAVVATTLIAGIVIIFSGNALFRKNMRKIKAFRKSIGATEAQVPTALFANLQPNTSRRFYSDLTTKEVWILKCDEDGEITLIRPSDVKTEEETISETSQNENDQLWQRLGA